METAFSVVFPADHKSITEQEPAARFQNTEQFMQHPEPPGNMAHDIVREGRVKVGIWIGQSLRSVAVLEADPVGEVSSMRECVAVAETVGVDVNSHHAAPCGLSNLHCVSS